MTFSFSSVREVTLRERGGKTLSKLMATYL